MEEEENRRQNIDKITSMPAARFLETTKRMMLFTFVRICVRSWYQ